MTRSPKVAHQTVKVGDLDIFYREAGPNDAPAILLLHGFPTSSQMFRNLIPLLADEHHVVAPDYPGYGHSSMPSREQFAYTFDNLAAVIDEFTETVELSKYALYVQDYGAPVGYRLAAKHPERVTAIVVQNRNAYDEGLDNPLLGANQGILARADQPREARRHPQPHDLRRDPLAIHPRGKES